MSVSGSVEELHQVLENAAGVVSPGLSAADGEAAVNAAVLRCARNHPYPAPARRGDPDEPVAVAAGLAAAAGQIGELDSQVWGLPAEAGVGVDWARFGLVVPVLAGSPGAGASVLAAVLADATTRAGHAVLLVDAADPARSGLAAVTDSEGRWSWRPHPQLGLRYSWREQVLVARMESGLPAIIPGMVPPPPLWAPPAELAMELGGDPAVTVVDIGHDGWRAAANPLSGAGAWLREGDPAPGPVLVVRATRPSLRHAEQVLARLDPWIAAGTAAPVEALVVTGTRRWPAGVTGAAGLRLAGLIDAAVFIPLDDQVAVGGVTAEPLPPRLLDAVAPLLGHWGLLTAPSRNRKGSR